MLQSYGPVVAALAVLIGMLVPSAPMQALRERVIDLTLNVSGMVRPPTTTAHVVIVDIDAPSIARFGDWPWRREQLADIVEAVAAARPAAIGLDILLAGPDVRSPAALARRLAQETGRDDLQRLSQTLADGDRTLSVQLANAPAVLGWVLDDKGASRPTQPPFLTQGTVSSNGWWRSRGALGASDPVASAVGAAGTISLTGDGDGIVRRAPLFVVVAGGVYPGFAPELLRMAAGASGYIVSGQAKRLAIGDGAINLPDDGQIRLVPKVEGRTLEIISAADILERKSGGRMQEGAIVLIGSSAPESGGLRASLFGPLTASTVIQTQAVRQMLAGVSPRDPPLVWGVEAALGFLLIGIAMGCARRSTIRATALFVVSAIALACLVIWLAGMDWLLNPLPAIAAGTVAFAGSSSVAFARTRRRERQVRQRFAQHLAPSVVERIVASPEALRLSGERRMITALFTDIEGFTTTSRETAPEALIATLDRYFEGVSAAITRHGGMIDKFVGDAVHAFFNMPLDLPNHSRRAIECARDIARWTEAFRSSASPHAVHIGRTRIGIESGIAVVGEVGLSTKLDYTAYGDVVNLTKRLEEMNKMTQTTILIGPEAAGRNGDLCRHVGAFDVRGVGLVEVYTLADPDTEGAGAAGYPPR